MIDCGSGSFFLSPSQLLSSPSSRHGILSSTEQSLRLYGCEIIQEAGILLRLPQVVMATAQVLFHRFFCKRSFTEFDARNVAASCLWLSIKLEEVGTFDREKKRSRIPDVLDVFQRIRARREGDAPVADSADPKQELLTLEKQILVELGFVCHVEHPHKFLLGYLKSLEATPELVQEAWSLVNDSLRTTLCVRFQSNVVACGIVFAAARRLAVPLPESPPWWLLFDATLEQILEVCRTLADLYRQPKVQYIEVRDCVPSQPVSSDKKLEESENCKDSSKNFSLLSPGSATKLINSCFMNGSGMPVLNGVFLGGFLIAPKKTQNEEPSTKKANSMADDNKKVKDGQSKDLPSRSAKVCSSHDSLPSRSSSAGKPDLLKDETKKRDREESRDVEDMHRKRSRQSEDKSRRRSEDCYSYHFGPDHRSRRFQYVSVTAGFVCQNAGFHGILIAQNHFFPSAG